jgi:phosphatidylserine/phosphatidylglycerophosphate/cardiolipin synthase-like enzyme
MRSKQIIGVILIIAVAAVFWVLQKDKPGSVSPPTPTPEVSKPAPKKADWYDVYFSQVYDGDPVAAKANPNSIDRKLAEKLSIAQKSIDAALHELDSDVVTAALIDAHKRGVTVHVVTETDYMEEHSIEALQKARIPIVNDDGRSGLMHNKFIIVDERYVWTGSLNTTDNGAYKNNNNAIWIDSPQLAQNFSSEFKEMYDGKQFGGRSEPSLLHPVVTMPDGTKIHTFFAPENDVITSLLDHIWKAEKSIYFMAFSFTHDGLGEAMKERFKAGVDVQGVFEKRGSDTSYSEYPSMKAMGIPVMQDTNKWALHHKVIIIDGKTVVTGSFNFSKNAAKTNDENLLLIEGNTHIAQLYTEEFERVSGKTVPSATTPVSRITSRVKTVAPSKPNINKMTQKELENLPGIGPKLAEKIIDGRPYRNVSDLKRVDGLGEQKIDAIRDLVVAK